MANIEATLDLCTWSYNKSGIRMLKTRYSNYQTVRARYKSQIQTYAKGMAYGLSYKYKNAAVRINYTGGGTEEVFDFQPI